MAQMYNPYIGQIPGQPYTTPQTWLPQSNPMPNANLPYATSSPKPQAIFGKVVQNESQITPNDVPMDGTIALFPLQDYSKIIAKQWTQNGTISTVTYSPDTQSNQNGSESLTIDELSKQFNDRFDQIEDLLTSPSKSATKDVSKNA